MTDKITIELTREQAEDLFDCINIAALHYAGKAEQAKRELGAYDWRLSSADKLQAYEDRRDLFSKRWVEFYQIIKVVRRAEKTTPAPRGVWEDLGLSKRELFKEFCGGEA